MLETQETLCWSLGQEDPLEEEMATHSSILAWETPWTEEPGGLESMQLQRVEHDWATKHSTHTHTVTVISQAFKSKENLRTRILFLS